MGKAEIKGGGGGKREWARQKGIGDPLQCKWKKFGCLRETAQKRGVIHRTHLKLLKGYIWGGKDLKKNQRGEGGGKSAPSPREISLLSSLKRGGGGAAKKKDEVGGKKTGDRASYPRAKAKRRAYSTFKEKMLDGLVT